MVSRETAAIRSDMGKTGSRPGNNGQGELVRERWARESQSVELSCRLWLSLNTRKMSTQGSGKEGILAVGAAGAEEAT